MQWSLWIAAGMMTMVAAAVSGTAPSDAGKKEPDEYIKVEVKGTLRHGIAAIGGETTGTVITAKGVTWELDLRQDPKFGKQADRLNGQRVVVTGTLEVRPGIEIRRRWIVTVSALKPADKAKDRP